MDPISPELQKILDQNSATHARFYAELISLRRFVANLYELCSDSRYTKQEVYEMMQQHADHEEQRLLEFAETTMPAATARIDENRPPLDSDDVMPPQW